MIIINDDDDDNVHTIMIIMAIEMIDIDKNNCIVWMQRDNDDDYDDNYNY